MIKEILYKTKTASETDVKHHLLDCSDSFIPSLSSRVNVEEYSKKIADKAVTFEAWSENELIGMIATYFNTEGKFGFITSVSVSKQFMGAGIASQLLKMCVDYAFQNKYKEIKLEVNKDNTPAINFYKKYNFTQTETKNDSLFMNHVLSN